MSDPVQRLRQALVAGDLAAAREAFAGLERSLLALVDGQQQQHLCRLLDLGQTAAEAAHELRQPLSAVKSFTQLLALTPDLPDSAARRVGLILENTERIETHVERLSRYSQGMVTTSARQPCDLNDAIEAAIELLRLEKKPTLTLERAMAPDLPAAAADPMAVQQIFINLLGNAYQALANQSGRIRIRTRLSDGHLEARVEDDGPGVPAEHRDHLFEPFVTSKDNGTGLGLSISRRIAEQHGGSLELVNRERGATFLLRLPIGVEP